MREDQSNRYRAAGGISARSMQNYMVEPQSCENDLLRPDDRLDESVGTRRDDRFSAHTRL